MMISEKEHGARSSYLTKLVFFFWITIKPVPALALLFPGIKSHQILRLISAHTALLYV